MNVKRGDVILAFSSAVARLAERMRTRTMTTITPELRQAIEQAGDVPARVVDPETNTAYVLLRADLYERYKALFEEDDYDVREMYPHVDKVMAEDDANDPALASYQDQSEPKP